MIAFFFEMIDFNFEPPQYHSILVPFEDIFLAEVAEGGERPSIE